MSEKPGLSPEQIPFKHKPDAVVMLRPMKVDPAFLERMFIDGVVESSTPESFGNIVQTDMGDGTFLQIHNPGYKAPHLNKEDATRVGYPFRIDVKGSEVIFNMHLPIQGESSISMKVEDPEKQMGSQDNPFILDAGKTIEQVTALSRLIAPQVQAEFNVGVYARLKPISGDPTKPKPDEILFINGLVPSLDTDFDESGMRLAKISYRDVHIDAFPGASFQQIKPLVEDYSVEVARPFADYFNLNLGVHYMNDREVIDIQAYDPQKPVGDNVLIANFGIKKSKPGEIINPEKPTKYAIQKPWYRRILG